MWIFWILLSELKMGWLILSKYPFSLCMYLLFSHWYEDWVFGFQNMTFPFNIYCAVPLLFYKSICKQLSNQLYFKILSIMLQTKGQTTPLSRRPFPNPLPHPNIVRTERSPLVCAWVVTSLSPRPSFFPDIHPHPNIIKLYPFSMQIWTCEGSLNCYNFLI